MPRNERLPDWRARLEVYLSRVARRPFRPGRMDCALFGAGAVEAMTGVDLAASFRGGYRSLAAGLAALQAEGYADHVAFVAAHFPEVAPAFAQVGDLVLAPGAIEGGPGALGIVQGPGLYVLSPTGLSVISRRKAEKAFSV